MLRGMSLQFMMWSRCLLLMSLTSSAKLRMKSIEELCILLTGVEWKRYLRGLRVWMRREVMTMMLV